MRSFGLEETVFLKLLISNRDHIVPCCFLSILWMDDGAACLTVKCGLGRIRPLPALKEHIEAAAQTLQEVSSRGFILATDLALQALNSQEVVPIASQTWWYQIFASCGVVKDRQVGKNSKEAIRLFGEDSISKTKLDYLWPILSTLAKDTVTRVVTLLAAGFHNQLKKSIRREVLLWENDNQTLPAKEIGWKVVDCVCRQLTGHQTQTEWPSAAPKELQVHLEKLVKPWTKDYCSILPCPTPAFINSKRAPLLLSWMFDLSKHLDVCKNKFAKLEEDRERRLPDIPKGLMKHFRLLPLASGHVPHVAIDTTTLESLLAAVTKAGGSPETKALLEEYKAERKNSKEGLSDEVKRRLYLKAFPGAARLLPRGSQRCSCFLRSDGVDACVVFIRQHSISPPKSGKKRQSPSLDAIPNVSKKFLVGVDPGRRDLVSCWDGEASTSISTKEFRHRAHVRQTTSLTEHILTKANLLVRLEALPCSKSPQTWSEYTRAVCPLLDLKMASLRTRSIRRARFGAYTFQDKAIDHVCRKVICGGREPKDTLVAFGAAGSCSTGFGYAPAPQSRLRHRLQHVHGACVVLIDEYLTSQVCSRCGGKCLLPGTSKNKETGKKFNLHGVRFCSSCKNGEHNRHALFLHRDVNAARNMWQVGLNLKEGRARPVGLRRPSQILPCVVVQGAPLSGGDVPCSKRRKVRDT